MSNFRFANSEYLYFLLAIPILVLVYIVFYRQKRKALKEYGDIEVISQLMPDISFSRPVFKFVLILLALSSLIVAIARPQFGSRLQEVKRKGIELMICLDVSNSMLAQDLEPTRLDRAKQSISKLLDGLRNDKIGLIVFAGDAYIQLPLTTDYASAKMFLQTINTNIVPKQGTAIGSAIEMASKSFSPESDINKAVIVITDGENHEDDAVEIAKEVNEQGIKIFTLGMGEPQGSPIPINPYSQAKNYRTDKQGNVVISKLDELTLQKVAIAGGGKYFRASNARVGLDNLFEEIENIEKKEFEAKVYADYEDRFQYFVAMAMVLLLIDFLTLERKNKYFKNIDLFKYKIG
jgi:Ca-activated chloride channel homolog